MKTIIRGGQVVSMDPAVGDLPAGDVLIEDGVIVDVSPHVDAPDAEVIDASDRIVMPGFVDNHRHTWQTAFRGIGSDWTFPEWAVAMHGTVKPRYAPEDVRIGTLVGRLEALSSGVTTMLDWFHCTLSPAHADAAIEGLRASAGRSVFCYGAGWGTTDPVDAEIRRVRAALADDDARVGLAWGLRGVEDTSVETVAAELAVAEELGLRTSLHIASDGSRPIAELAEHDLLRDTTTYVHVTGVGDDELRMIAEAGGSVSISPDVELKMGFGLPMTGRMAAAGLKPTLSVDDVPSVAGDLFSAMRTALAVQRGVDGTQSSRSVLEAVTIDAAASMGLDQRIGSLTPGKRADIVLLRADDITMAPVTDPVASVVSSAHPGIVDTVLVDGIVVKKDGELVGVDVRALIAQLTASRDRVAAASGVPLDGTWQPAATA
ncbi:amidohydrolase family protein [Microtetraspora malaysiensis]|uniref:amidohydrolase family protein n=1 Tax=Microtetraspora malaysiensis TaxID=161358 RepID=UPI003D921FDD